jgi:lactoylglutathione lyase
MKFAKPCIDVALMTDQLDASKAFWQDEVGLAFEETLNPRRGMAQHRFGVNGSVLKLNHVETLPASPPSGIRELWIARDGLDRVRSLAGPGGERVRLVPVGERGIEGIGVVMHVRDRDAHTAFYRDVLGFEAAPEEGVLRCGHSLVFLQASADAPSDASIAGPGYRYLTVQIFSCDAAHRRAVELGAREGAPPRRAGDVAIYSMVRDPDGNWVELSQRASLTGPLD